MNLSLVLNSATAPGTAAPAPAATLVSPEMAAFQDFLSLVGLAPLAQEVTDDALLDPVAEGVAESLDPNLAALTGNILPPALPVLPQSVAAPPQAANPGPAMLPAATAAQALVQAQVAGLPLPPVTAQQIAPEMDGNAKAAKVPVQPTMPLAVSIEAVPAAPVVPARTAASQPVLAQVQLAQAQLAQAQLAQAQLAQAQLAMQGEQVQPGAKSTVRREEVAGQIAAPLLASDAPAAETARPVSRAAALAAADSQPQTAVPFSLVAPTTTTIAAATTTASDTAPARHDFEAVVDRLTEARELARPSRADLHLTHREFGAVSVQFELAGHALKVAMSSPDQAFAPAVQAALAERPLAVADVARADNGQPRADAVPASTAAWQAGTSADGQRGDGQPRSARQSGVADQPQQARTADDDYQQAEAGARESGRFA